ncbi:aromatase/cyclase [Actinocrispum wychmicini]|uniref:Aromatase n=1 Tax=Actinocrispum wychmicini TaxID=1213861 RepID=A0A4R2JSY0_9PSEU|nr:aromatase/cyclase [Actinocrispum wychmicini]TCO62052.1 aromatase [Actinocrispum wychmicini]
MHVEHRVTVPAAAESVYELLADVTLWPATFGPTIDAERLSLHDGKERIRLCALANGTVKTWVSRRTLDPGALRIGFLQELSAPPVAEMGGEWVLTPAGDRTEVSLTHDFRALGDDEEALAWIAKAVDTNSHAELAALAAAVAAPAGAFLDFTDEVRTSTPLQEMYDFLYRAAEWPTRLSHVDSMDLVEDPQGVQRMRMNTRTKDGGVHTTSSVRICTAPSRIAYKQTETPALMAAHAGRWLLRQDGDEVVAVSRHQVRINPDAVGTVLGPDAGLAQAGELIRSALGANSLATLNAASAHVTGAGRG